MNDLPFSDGVDDVQYVYRFQHRSDLRQMREAVGENLTPSLWSSKRGCPHKHYVKLASSLPEGQAIYTLSVWRSEAAAWRGWLRSENANDRVLLRIPRNALSRSQLRCIDDDYLPNEAFLLYEVGPYADGQVYGTTRIPWSVISQTEAVWRPIQADEEDLRGVGNPFSDNYSNGDVPSQDLDSDFGLPGDEIILREHLRFLAKLHTELSSFSRWNIIEIYKSCAALKALQILWLGLNHSEPRISAAIRRISSILPRDHPAYRYLKASGQISDR
ncbi:hypothetical protein FBT96_06465 [Rhodobacter capsulatus]|uniref:Uncharacterized protein n=2 Tax=Rhodobacter capsulatus TaxID=1061 RepID=A0A4U1JTA7_RHOCA|nr:hypothetical protein FBT96_06465 [Rhodobacter capsulatus]